MNKQRSFNNKQKKKLGLYIYAYRNPIDMRIFRIGQGRGDDVFEIFNRADKAMATADEVTAETIGSIGIGFLAQADAREKMKKATISIEPLDEPTTGA